MQDKIEKLILESGFYDHVNQQWGGDFGQELNRRFIIDGAGYHEGDDFALTAIEQNKALNYFRDVVIPHKIEVCKAGLELVKICLGNYIEAGMFFDLDEFKANLFIHDMSKFSYIEAIGYSGWDFKTKTGDKQAFDIAWNHHIHNNPHHPEYWLTFDKSGFMDKCLQMPDIYIFEMVADWIGAGAIYGKPLVEWLPANLPNFLFHPESAITLRRLLAELGIETYADNAGRIHVSTPIKP